MSINVMSIEHQNIATPIPTQWKKEKARKTITDRHALQVSE